MSSHEQISVLITHYFPEELIAPLRKISPRLAIRHIPTLDADADTLTAVWPDIEVLYTTTALPAPEQAPKLRWIQGHFAGIDHFGEHAFDSRVTVTNVSGIHATAMGEYVIGMILSFAHRFPSMIHYKNLGEWPKGRWDKFVPVELRQATLGIVGYGSIGREVARLAKAFGMRILAVKRRPAERVDTGWRIPGTGDAKGEIPERLFQPRTLTDMLPECDYVVLTVPLTNTSRHMFGVPEFNAMKHGAIFINVARGGIVDENALVSALGSGKLGGAALDVFETEPLPSDSPLWNFDNVVISPHVSGFTPHYDRRALAIFAENLHRYIGGKSLVNQVDVSAGY